LRKIMPLRDAWRLAGSRKSSGEIRVHLFPARRDVLIRLGTSDLDCLKKVFLATEYSLPFKFSPKVIVDAGANIGMATLYFATQYPGARIMAIEPEPSNFKILQQNCSGLANVTLLEAALWPLAQPVGIMNPQDEKFAFTVAAVVGEGSLAGRIPTVNVPELLKKTAGGRIDLLKLDIEGAEWELFSINPESWLDKVQVIAIELHDRHRDGCAKVFYSAILKHKFTQEINGENVFIKFENSQ
jgi:FkbM family methyltransferase